MSVDKLEDIQYGKRYLIEGASLNSVDYKRDIDSRKHPTIVTVTTNEYNKNSRYKENNPWIYMQVDSAPGIEYEMQWELFKDYATLIGGSVIIKQRNRLDLIFDV